MLLQGAALRFSADRAASGSPTVPGADRTTAQQQPTYIATASPPVDALASITTAAWVVTVSCFCCLAGGSGCCCPMARKLRQQAGGVARVWLGGLTGDVWASGGQGCTKQRTSSDAMHCVSALPLLPSPQQRYCRKGGSFQASTVTQ